MFRSYIITHQLINPLTRSIHRSVAAAHDIAGHEYVLQEAEVSFITQGQIVSRIREGTVPYRNVFIYGSDLMKIFPHNYFSQILEERYLLLCKDRPTFAEKFAALRVIEHGEYASSSLVDTLNFEARLTQNVVQYLVSGNNS